MTPYRDQVLGALRVVSVRSGTRYAWLGRLSGAPDPAVLDIMIDSERRRFLVATLCEELYASFYCPGGAGPARRAMEHPAAADPSLVDALSVANTGRGGWEPGWIVARLDEPYVVIEGPWVRIAVPRHEVRGARLRPGVEVSLRTGKDLPAISPGFYTATGDAALTGANAIIRVYWHVAPAGAPALMRALTSRLNAAGAPFRLKVANHPARFERCDTAVLYVDADAFGAQRAMLEGVAASLGRHLRPPTPAFTLRLAPGIAGAEDPPTGESFGLHRCGLLAEGIVRAREQGAASLAARLEVVAACFAEAGVDLDAPYRAGCDVL